MIRIETPDAPAAIGPYSQAVTLDGWIFASGQIPLEPASGEVAEGGVEAQTCRVLENLSAVLEAAGGSLETVVKTTVYLSAMEHFPAVNRVYGEYFGSHRPARATVAVRGLPKAVDVEIEAIARIGPVRGEPEGREQSRPSR
ncbi:MAG: RidA family protein [Gammaproteobacteria bacterium]|nr:RidA family protein [Gammaproteobacteria bacterium]MDE0247656.1 RidA family protein [Gammaproteobacteria bacterium]